MPRVCDTRGARFTARSVLSKQIAIAQRREYIVTCYIVSDCAEHRPVAPNCTRLDSAS
jgi:hypothetical protein